MSLPPQKTLFIIAFSLLTLGVLLLAGEAWVFYHNLQHITVHPTTTPTPTNTATPKPHIDAFNQLEPYTLLLLGYGGGTHEGGKLTDSMMLVDIVPEQKKVFLISIPRDLWMALPVNGTTSAYFKINAAYAIGADDRRYPNKPAQYTGAAGGGELAKYAVSTVTGIPVNNFLSLDFSGFAKSIDTLGGVDVKVERTLDDPSYPIEGKESDTCGKSPEEITAINATMSASLIETKQVFACRYEHLHFDPGITHMNGETALKYVRSRHAASDGGDFNRAARQRNLLVAVKQRVLSIGFLPKAIPFITSLTYDLQTDVPLDKMGEFAQYKETLSSYEIVNVALTDQNVLIQTHSPNGQDILEPKAGQDRFDTIRDWLQTQLK